MALGRKTGGRTKGTPNRLTKEKKLFMQDFVDENYELAKQLWQDIAATDKRTALKLYLDAAEFSRPRLARTELVGDQGAPLNVVVNVLKE